MAEWLIALVLKTRLLERVTWVQILLSPQNRITEISKSPTYLRKEGCNSTITQ